MSLPKEDGGQRTEDRNGWIYAAVMIGVAVLCLLSSGRAAQAATYYIAANGSDSNNGTSKSTPWLHAPGMNGCSANCASTPPQPGDQFILRGGDSWHVTGGGNPVGLPWEWTWSGTAANRIYVGADTSWFTGLSWSRPKLNGDNPLSTTAVASCQFQTSNANVTNVFLHAKDGDYTTNPQLLVFPRRNYAVAI